MKTFDFLPRKIIIESFENELILAGIFEILIRALPQTKSIGTMKS